MRRLPHLALVCALLCLLCGAGPALAAAGHHHAGSRVHHTTSATSSHTTTAAVHAAASGAKATTHDGLTVLNDCQNHGQLTRAYPVSWLRKALSMMSAGTSQYSNCSTVLHQALLHDLPGQGGSGGSSGSGATTIVIIVVIVLVILAALLGALALRRRRGGGPPSVA